jgi:predicted nucleic acid-binding protein
VTVIDSSAVVDLLLGVGVADEMRALMADGSELVVPDVLAFEVLAVLRRETL